MKEAAPSVSVHTIFEVSESGLVEQVETVSDEVGLLEGLESVEVGMSLFDATLKLGPRIGHYAKQSRLQGDALKFQRNVWSPKGRFRFEVGVWPKPEGGFSIAISPIAGAEAPEQRARLHRDIVEHANDAIVVCEAEPIDLPGPRILFVNPAFERMTGYAAAEVVGLTPRILQGPGTDRATLDRIQAALAAWQPVDAVLRNYRKDGSEFWLELHLEPVQDEAGWYTHWIAVQRDITERRENERWLRLLRAGIDQIERPIFLTDADFGPNGPRIVFANAGSSRALGTPVAELIGRPLSSLWADGTVEEAAALRAAMEAGEATDGAIRCRRRGAADFWLNWHLGQGIRDEPGPITHFVIIAHDSTAERQTVAERLRAARADALVALSRGVVHNFNNKLASVIGALSLARLKISSGDLASVELLIRQADDSAGEAAAIASQLQSFARGESTGRARVGLVAMVRELVEFSLQGTAIVPEFHLEAGAPEVVVDVALLQQSVAALAINAREAMPSGGRLIVRLEGAELAPEEVPGLPGGNYTRISLQDTGTTGERTALDRIFELQLPAHSERREFGLAAAYAFAREHGGHLLARSLPDQGAIFMLLLPAAPELATRPETALVRGTGRILVMDDEPAVRQTFVQMAEALGYDAMAAKSSVEALMLYTVGLRTGHRFDAVVLDLTTRGGEGCLQTMRKLLELDPNAIVLVSSGYEEDGGTAGAMPFLHKPYRVEQLSEKLAAALQRVAPNPVAP